MVVISFPSRGCHFLFSLFACARIDHAPGLRLDAEAAASSLRGAATWRVPLSDIKLAHIVSPFPGEGVEQTAVLRSYSAAKLQAESWPTLNQDASIRISVSVLAAQVVGEEPIKLPNGLQRAPPLNRSTASEFGCRRSIPFPSDLMRVLQAEAPDATLYLLSNADIGVTPEFYEWVAAKYLASGAESMSVLKVMIPHSCDGVFLGNNLTASYQFARTQPQTHPGFDMFVWEASKTSDIIAKTGDVFFGYPPVGQAIYDALIASSRTELYSGEHVTFHFGAEGENGRGDPHVVSLPPIPDGCTYEGVHHHKHEESGPDCDYPTLNGGAGVRYSTHR